MSPLMVLQINQQFRTMGGRKYSPVAHWLLSFDLILGLHSPSVDKPCGGPLRFLSIGFSRMFAISFAINAFYIFAWQIYPVGFIINYSHFGNYKAWAQITPIKLFGNILNWLRYKYTKFLFATNFAWPWHKGCLICAYFALWLDAHCLWWWREMWEMVVRNVSSRVVSEVWKFRFDK